MAHLVPEGAWDSHVHVLNPVSFPYITPRYCSPAPALVSSYPSSITGCRNIVVVHASMQGSSHASLLDTLSQGPSLGLNLRCITTIADPETISDAELDELHAAGVRGTRLYLTSWRVMGGPITDAKARELQSLVKRLASRFGRLGWVITIVCPLAIWVSLADVLRDLDPRVHVLADHLAGAFPGEEETEGFQTLLSLVREGKLFVKLSAFDRTYSGAGGDMDSLEPIVKAVVEAGPDRILFGTDWPHVGPGKPVNDSQQDFDGFEGFREVSDDMHIRKLREWIKDDETWHKLFVANPQKLFA